MSARDRLALMIVAAAALVLGLWFMAVAPERKQAAKAGADLAQAQNTRASAVASERAALRAQSNFNANVTTISELQRAVPVSLAISPLLSSLESTANSEGVDFRSLSSGSGGSGSGSGSPAAAPASASGPVAGPTGAATGAVNTANASSQAAANANPGGGSSATPGPGGAASAPAATSFPTQSFTLTVAGDFTHLQHFLDTVNRWTSVSGRNVTVAGRLLNLQSVSLTHSGGGAASSAGSPSSGGGAGAGSMLASIIMTVYTLPATEASPAALLAQLDPSATAPFRGAPGATRTPVAAASTAARPAPSPVHRAPAAAGHPVTGHPAPASTVHPTAHPAPAATAHTRPAAHSPAPPAATVGVPR